jgi:hypothetical protein
LLSAPNDCTTSGNFLPNAQTTEWKLGRTILKLYQLWFLLSALDTLIFVMTGGVLKEPNKVPRTVQEFQPYGAQFGEAHAVEAT